MATLTGFRADRDGAFIDKDTEAVLDYSVNWTDWMPSGDSINSSTFTIAAISGDSDPLTVDSSAVSGTTCTAVISGGTAGNIYTVSNKIVTNNNITERRHFRISVKARSV